MTQARSHAVWLGRWGRGHNRKGVNMAQLLAYSPETVCGLWPLATQKLDHPDSGNTWSFYTLPYSDITTAPYFSNSEVLKHSAVKVVTTQ